MTEEKLSEIAATLKECLQRWNLKKSGKMRE